QVIAQGRDHAHAGDHYATLTHTITPSSRTLSGRIDMPHMRGAASAAPARLIETKGLRLDVRLDVVDGLLHRGDLLGVFVRDFALELFFQGHHQLDGVERIGAEVIDERCAGGEFFFFDAKLFYDDLLDAFFDAAHWIW